MCSYIVKYKVRFLVGDFNLALWVVIPEMRARGMQINLLAWQPWKVEGAESGTSVRCDTCGIFAIGGITSIKWSFDCSVLDVCAPERGNAFKLARKSVKDAQGKPTRETQPHELFTVPHPLVEHGTVGHPLKSFQPAPAERKKLYVQQSFTISNEPACPAVAAMKEMAARDRDAFKRVPQADLAQHTFSWGPIPLCKGKPCDPELFDPGFQLLRSGAHVPLQVYVGGNTESRRSPEANRRRARKKQGRRWDSHGDGGWGDQ